VVLVIAPWNYPAQLALLPLVGILGAGNCAILKPSEVAPATSALLASIIPKYFNSDTLAVVEGGIPETTELLEQRFDHIFYTGNGTVGRIVMAAAAKHLTPVTLELGGKSPCYVDTHANLDVAAKRIVWAKFFNAGQTCVAPDYILAHKDIHDELLERMTAAITAFYGDNIQNSPDYGRIINERHHRRLMDLLKGETLLCGGYGDETIKFIEPTIVRDVSPDSSLMREEIFGPILPVLPIESTDQAIQFILEREKPLALYVFSENKDSYQRVLQQTSSGGACVNDAMTHLSALDLPFGGVGESGMGHYHGKHGFDTFSHQKSVLDKSSRFDLPLRYPPFNDAKAKWLKRLV